MRISPHASATSTATARRGRFIRLAAALLMSAVAVTVSGNTAVAVGCGNAGDFADGAGILIDPYLVSTPEQLAAIGAPENLGCAYLLTTDLDLSSVAPWTPIGTDDEPFAGQFDGGGFVITGLDVDANTYRRGHGLFGWAVGATLENVVFDGATLYAAQTTPWVSSSGGSIGTLVGRAEDSTIRNIEVRGTVTIASTRDIGGVVGIGLGIAIENVLVDADITITIVNNSGEGIGGVVGRLIASDNGGSTATGLTVTGLTVRIDPATNTSTNRVRFTGGLVGGLGAELRDSRSSYVVIENEDSRRRYDYAGGAVGYLFDGVIERVSVTNLSIPGGPDVDEALGGLVGQVNFGTIRWSRADGRIGGPNDDEIGGLIGEVYSVEIEDSYTTVDVTGATATGSFIGSVVASGYSPDEAFFPTIRRSYGAGSVEGGTGGFFGDLTLAGDYLPDPVVEDSFWDTETSGQTTSAGDYGTGLPTLDLQTLSTFADAGWDIVAGWVAFDPAGSKVWGLCESYPYLLWEFDDGVESCIPRPPIDFVASLNGTSVTFTWLPADGPTPESYQVTLEPGGLSCTAVHPETSCTIDGLQPGVPYTAVATASNQYGTSGESLVVEIADSNDTTTTTDPSSTVPGTTDPSTTDPGATTVPTDPGATTVPSPTEPVILPPTGSTPWALIVFGVALLLAGSMLRIARRPG